MDYDIEFTDAADEDLEGIREYLSRFYPSTPKQFRDEFNRKMKLLQFNPHMAYYEYNPIYRKANVKNYLVFFTIDEDARLITVHHVRSARQRPFGSETT